MNTIATMKLAASALVLAAATVGCSSVGSAKRVGNASDTATVKQTHADAARAQRLLAKGRAGDAVPYAEAAVAGSPRDADYRLLLAQSYLAAGRLTSAETSFADTLTLDPERERSALNLALVQTALGKRSDAMRTLADYRDKLPAADFGLAVALAGDPTAAVGILETAARGADATPKTRQNLALAYALAGHWAKARATAQQDLDPTIADKRVLGWASFTSPTNSWDQVASLLGVTPVEDGGQPTRLALAPSGTAVAVADIASPGAELASVELTAPAMAEAAGVEAVPPSPPVDVQAVAQPAFETPVAAIPVVRTPRVTAKTAVRTRAATSRAPFSRPTSHGRYVVQFGAFQSAANAERAWSGVVRRFGLAAFDPVSAVAKVRDASLVRLGVSGFATRGDADRMCGRVRAGGGACFVRVQAGDRMAAWAKRGRTQVASR